MTADFAAATWRKSSRSNAEQECVEVAQVPTVVGIRDSKDPEGGHLAFGRTEFRALLDRVKAGDLDL